MQELFLEVEGIYKDSQRKKKSKLRHKDFFKGSAIALLISCIAFLGYLYLSNSYENELDRYNFLFNETYNEVEKLTKEKSNLEILMDDVIFFMKVKLILLQIKYLLLL